MERRPSKIEQSPWLEVNEESSPQFGKLASASHFHSAFAFTLHSSTSPHLTVLPLYVHLTTTTDSNCSCSSSPALAPAHTRSQDHEAAKRREGSLPGAKEASLGIVNEDWVIEVKKEGNPTVQYESCQSWRREKKQDFPFCTCAPRRLP